MSWQTYVDTNIVGSGHATQAALLSSADGSTWATSAGFQVTAQEGAAIVAGIDQSDKLQSTGVTINGVKYFAIKAEPGLFYGKKGAGGVCIAKSTQVITVGVYGEGINPANCNSVVEGIRDYFVGIGY